ncbi:MAG: cadmium resistance transporter [Planctomycetota bacterium]
MLETILIGGALFASTNIDDVFLTMAFFADPGLRPRAIVAGKYAGIAALVLTSVAAAACALAVPEAWIALLGLAPLGLGIQRLVAARRTGSEPASGDEEAAAKGGSFIAQAASVAAITAANGGDNLGVYIPVFAQDLGRVPAYAAIFAVMTAVWCVVGRALVTHRLVAASMRRLAAVLLPWVLIGLGLWILKDAIGLVRPEVG